MCQFGNLQATISYVFIYQVSSGLRLPRGPCLGMSCPSEGLVTQANDHLPRRSQIWRQVLLGDFLFKLAILLLFSYNLVVVFLQSCATSLSYYLAEIVLFFLSDSVPLLQVDSSKTELDIRASRSVNAMGLCIIIWFLMYMTHICICTSSLSDLFSIPKLGNVSG